MLPEAINMKFFGEGVKEIPSRHIFYATLVGLAVGWLISAFTEYYTALGKKPVLNIVQNSSTGAATNIIAGLATGMKSTFSSVILFAVAIWGSYELAGFYGVAIAASAMMATTAMQLAIDAFGPIADNAGGVAEMSELPKEVRQRTDVLDSVGNTTAAVGKGFAIASAALTALALFAAYVTFTGIDGINIFKADVLAALFIGGMIPVIFSALAMQSVGKAAMDMVNEVRRQFREIPGIMEGNRKTGVRKMCGYFHAGGFTRNDVAGRHHDYYPNYCGRFNGSRSPWWLYGGRMRFRSTVGDFPEQRRRCLGQC